MKVLLTGAAGRLGAATHARLIDAGFDVLATDRSLPPSSPGPLKVANLLDREACYDLVAGAEAVVHLANLPNDHLADPQTTFCQNVTMNMNLFQAAEESGVAKIAFSSSVQVTPGEGDPPRHPYLPLDGDLPPSPRNAYALSKATSELQLQYLIRRGAVKQAVAIRFPYLHHKEHKGFAWMKGRPTEGFAYLAIEEAADLLAAVTRSDLPGYRTYFPARRTPLGGAPIAELITSFPDTPLRTPVDRMDALVDISRITKETGWSPAC